MLSLRLGEGTHSATSSSEHYNRYTVHGSGPSPPVSHTCQPDERSGNCSGTITSGPSADAIAAAATAAAFEVASASRPMRSEAAARASACCAPGPRYAEPDAAAAAAAAPCSSMLGVAMLLARWPGREGSGSADGGRVFAFSACAETGAEGAPANKACRSCEPHARCV